MEVLVPSEVILHLEEMATDSNDDIEVMLQETEWEQDKYEVNEIGEIEHPLLQEQELLEEQFGDTVGILEKNEHTKLILEMEQEPEPEQEDVQVMESEENIEESDVSTTEDTVVTANGDQRKESEQRYRYNL